MTKTEERVLLAINLIREVHAQSTQDERAITFRLLAEAHEALRALIQLNEK